MAAVLEILQIRVPVLQAPMAGGPAGPELAAAVSRAGGLGMLGVMGLTADRVQADVARALELGATALAVNIQIAPSAPTGASAEAVAGVLAPFCSELGIPSEGSAGKGDPPLELVAAALEAGATVVSGALGDPAVLAPLASEAGVPLVAMVSSADEARASVAAGADVVVAQGAEAGGHRTTFDVSGELPLVGTLALVPRVVDAVSVPVVAAGGIMDGRGVAAAFALGASGAMLGTRFLLAAEATTPAVYKRALASSADTDTFVTDAVTGRPARWIRNAVTNALASGPPHLGWGRQRGAVEPLRQAAAAAGRADLLPMLAGQGAGLAGAVDQPAEEIVAEVWAQARAALAQATGVVG